MAYLFRARDRRLAEQTSRDIGLTLQRDYRTFNPANTIELSNRVPYYLGYVPLNGANYTQLTWVAGSQVSAAFLTLQALLTQLKKGVYQKWQAGTGGNTSIWPVKSINWAWVQALYAFINPYYATWCVTNNQVLPPGTTDWATAWNFNPG